MSDALKGVAGLGMLILATLATAFATGLVLSALWAAFQYGWTL